MLAFGAKVEVHEIIAGSQPLKGQLCAWIGGFRFSGYDGRGYALLWKRCFGRWMKVRYPLRDVRAARSSSAAFSPCPDSGIVV